MKILLFPDPGLREKSEPAGKSSGESREIIEKLVSVMKKSKGCVGIAAPQLGIHKRVVVVDVSGNKKAEKKSGLLVLVNPRIVSKKGTSVNREGCLSVPDFTGNVARAEVIVVEYFDADFNKRTLSTSGFEAIAVQHEIDHLDGILFIDRITNMKRDLFKRKKY